MICLIAIMSTKYSNSNQKAQTSSRPFGAVVEQRSGRDARAPRIGSKRSTEILTSTSAALIALVILASAALPVLAQDKVWPESNVKIDPQEVRNNVITKLNAGAKGAYTVTTDPPANFPVDPYPAAENATYTAQGTAFMAGTMKTKDTPDKVIDFYKQQVSQKGWTVNEHQKGAAETSGRAFVITATKEDGTLTISSITPKAGLTIVNVHSMKFAKPVAKP